MGFSKKSILILVFSLITLLLFSIQGNPAFAGSIKKQPKATELDTREKTEIIVKYKDLAKTESVAQNLMGKMSVTKFTFKKEFTKNKVRLVEISEKDDIGNIIKTLKQDPNVVYAQPNYKLKAFSVPDDPLFSDQWGLNNTGKVYLYNGMMNKGVNGLDINAVKAWDVSSGSGITVGILDSGIDINHPDLKDNIVPGWDFANNDSTVFHSSTEDMHGTHVAGIIAAKGNGSGIIGVAPNTKIMPLKFMTNNSGYTSDAIDAIEFAKARGIKIINCSFGTWQYDQALEDEMNNSGILFICAAGNYGEDTSLYPEYPANFDLPNIISVAAFDNRGRLASFSNYGSDIDVGAPGVDILSTLPGNKFGYLDGTSMAAPFVTGEAALIVSKFPGISYTDVIKKIKVNITAVGNQGQSISSNGIANAYDSLLPDIVQASTSWSSKTDLPSIRYCNKVVSLNGKLYSIGGYNNITGATNTLFEYDPSTDIWSEKQGMLAPKGSFGAAAVDGKIYVFGGLNDKALNSVEVYDPSANKWTMLPNMPYSAFDISTAVIDGKIFIMGGSDGLTTYFNTVEQYDPNTGIWTRMADLPSGITQAAAAVLDNKIYFIGGANNRCLNSVYEFDLSNNKWTVKASMPTIRNSFEAVAAGGRIYAIGGVNSNAYLSKVEVYNPVSDSWVAIDDMPTKRYAFGAASIGKSIYAVGGIGIQTNYCDLKTVEELNLLNCMKIPDKIKVITSEDTMEVNWDPVTIAEGYDIEYDHHIVDAGSNSSYNINNVIPSSTYLIRLRAKNTDGPGRWSQAVMASTLSLGTGSGLEGKYYDNVDFSSYRFSRIDKTINFDWSASSPSGILSDSTYSVRWAGLIEPRYSESYTFTISANDGIRLWVNNQLLIDHWTDHAVNEYSGSINLVSGKKYDIKLEYYNKTQNSTIKLYWSSAHQVKEIIPQNRLYVNRWSTAKSMPTPRTDFGSVEISGKIYVVGGISQLTNNGTPQGTVEVMDTSTNTWSTGASMPTPRYGLGLTVLGGKIYAIGGEDQYGWLNNVEIYDPVTNTWTKKTAMPTKRSYLGIEIANGKIYAIGGTNADSVYQYFLNTVEEYNPVTNTWTAKASMPSYRAYFGTSVVDNKIYAIGGIDASGYVSSVEVYSPQNNTWTQKSLLQTGRFTPGVEAFNGMIYVVGGSNIYAGGLQDSTEIYDTKTDSWVYGDSMPTGRAGLSVVASGNKLYAIGGYNLVNNIPRVLDIAEVYSPPGIINTTSSVSNMVEGKEHLGLITIQIGNSFFREDGVYNSTTVKLNPDELPEGISQGNVTIGNDGTTIKISLASDSTEDYDTNRTVTITIAKELFENPLIDDVTTQVIFPATVELKPAKPNVTFSFDGTNARKLMSTNNTMEYSFDGGTSYTPVTIVNQTLTQEELDRIDANKDILVRVAKTLRAPGSDAAVLPIAPGPAAPAKVMGDDIINTVSGMDTTMEYSTDMGKTWIKYTGSTTPPLAGDVTLNVRVAGKGLTMPGAKTTLVYTVDKPFSINAAYNGTTGDEGKENGKLITLKLTNSEFVTSINKDSFLLSGLPTGITKGAVTRVDIYTVTIALSGNSTIDYDNDYEIGIKIDKSQVLPLQPDTISTSAILPACDEQIPSAPAVSFSFKTNPGKLMGSLTTMEFSLDGGNTYIAVATKDIQLTTAQIAGLKPDKDIRVRVKATLRAPAGEVRLINIEPTPGLPAIDGTTADNSNSLTGINSTMEFTTDITSSTKTWKAYNGSNLPDLTGNLTIMVRTAATDSTPAGPAATYVFTATNPALNITAGYAGDEPIQGSEGGAVIRVKLANGKFAKALTATGIKLSGLPAGVRTAAPLRIDDTTVNIALTGKSTAYYDVGTMITISVDKAQVLPAQPAALTTAMRLLNVNKPDAPAGVDFIFSTDSKGIATGTLTGIDKTMEYSLDSSKTYTAITSTTGSVTLTAAQTAAITAASGVRVRIKFDLAQRRSASNDVIITIVKYDAPAVSGEDSKNSINGIDNTMIFSRDSGRTCSLYSGKDGVGDLTGNVVVVVKKCAAGHNLASDPVTLTFTATNPALTISAEGRKKTDDSPAVITESSEGSTYILVALANGQFTGTVSTTTVKVTGLPTGVTVPSTGGIILADTTHIKILLSGNSTENYDIDKTVTISVDKSLLKPAPQPVSLTAAVTFKHVDEDVPVAPVDPTFNFSYDSSWTLKGTLSGVENSMQYSLDDGKTYTEVTATNHGMDISAKVGSIAADKDILVRYKAITATKTPASQTKTIDITKQATPVITWNDDANSITGGFDSTMIFSTDTTATKKWTRYTVTNDVNNLPSLTGNAVLTVIKYASGQALPSNPATLNFTVAKPNLAVTAAFDGDAPVPGAASYNGAILVTLSGDTAQYGQFIASPTAASVILTGLPAGLSKGAVTVQNGGKTIRIALSGTNIGYYDTDRTVTVSIDKSQAIPAQAAALTTTLIFPGDKSDRPVGPAGVSFSFDGLNAGKLMGVNNTMEYSLDGGKTYTVITTTSVTLSTVQLALITADSDILVRYKADTVNKKPASRNAVIDITKPVAPIIDWSDITNCINFDSNVSTMEFSTDSGKTWTPCINAGTLKNNVTAKDLTGNLMILIRATKGGNHLTGDTTTLTFTATTPALELSGAYSGTTEGQESGNTITVTLKNGKFVTTLTKSEIKVDGLPKGIAVASSNGINRLSDTQIAIVLAGKSTEDYDSDMAVSVTVGKSQLLPAPQTAPVAATVMLPAIDESLPDAPPISFSFSGDNAGRLMGITTAMEYSFDGGKTYTQATAGNLKLSTVQLAGITVRDGIKVRIMATLRVPAGLDEVIYPEPGLKAPDLTADDVNNSVDGMDITMEYSLNNGYTWQRYDGSSLLNLSGDLILLVRKIASGSSVAGDTATISFSTANTKLSLDAGYNGIVGDEGKEDSKKITVTLPAGGFIPVILPYEIEVTGLPKGVTVGKIERTDNDSLEITLSGNSTVDYDEDMVVTVTVGRNLVMPSQLENLTATIYMSAMDEPQPEAPVISFSFDGENAGKMVGTDIGMEYSLDGGNTYTAVVNQDIELSKQEKGIITADNDIRVRVAETLRIPAGKDYIVDIQAGADVDGVIADDINNTLTGLDGSMEYSTDIMTTWTRYNKNNPPDLTGNIFVIIRKAAAGVNLPGKPELHIFTIDLNTGIKVKEGYESVVSSIDDGTNRTITVSSGTSVADLLEAIEQVDGSVILTFGVYTDIASNNGIEITNNASIMESGDVLRITEGSSQRYDEYIISTPDPTFLISENTYDFGEVGTSTTTTHQFTITSLNSDKDIRVTMVSSDNINFSVENDMVISQFISPGQSGSFDLVFLPSESKEYSCVITLLDTLSGKFSTLIITGTGI